METDSKELERLCAVAEFLAEQKVINDKATKFKLHFTLEALRIALDEAGERLGTDLDWIWESMYAELKPKCKTAKNNYLLGFFIYALTLHGAPEEAAKNTVADWQHCAERKCGMAFEEIKTLISTEHSGFWFDYQRAGKLDILNFISSGEARRAFPLTNKEVYGAFEKLKAQLNRDRLKRQELSTGIGTIDDQFKTNKRQSSQT